MSPSASPSIPPELWLDDLYAKRGARIDHDAQPIVAQSLESELDEALDSWPPALAPPTLASKKGVHTLGNTSARVIELAGGVIIEPTAFEPDAATHRDDYYYNALTNTLYKKVVTRKEPGVVVAHWQKVSE